MAVWVEKLKMWDIRTLVLCNKWSHERSVHAFFRLITRSGNGGLYLAAAFLFFLFDPERFPAFIVAATCAFAFGLVLQVSIKKAVKRLRPFKSAEVTVDFHDMDMPPDQFSFPSGHTTHAFVMLTLLAFFAPVVAAFVLPWAMLVGISRVYLAVHYPSDVMAGALLGVVCGVLGLCI